MRPQIGDILICNQTVSLGNLILHYSGNEYTVVGLEGEGHINRTFVVVTTELEYKHDLSQEFMEMYFTLKPIMEPIKKLTEFKFT